MKSPIKKIAVIGSGVIGSGWTIRLLANNKIVNVYDPKTQQQNFLKSEIWCKSNKFTKDKSEGVISGKI